jgi:carbonic anhydrase/acetyltransferase-like protein (isoleucine patch superfamily)
VSIGNYSAILENGVVISTPEHPVRVGQRTVFGHRATIVGADSVLVGRPPHVIRSTTNADRERLAVLRQHQTGLTDHLGTIVHGPMRAGEDMGTLYAYRDKSPSIGAGTVLFDSAEITSDVVIGKDTLIGAGMKIIGDSHGPVRIGSRVQVLENTGATPAARQRADHRGRRGDRPGRHGPRMPHRLRQHRRTRRDRVRRQRDRSRVRGPRRGLRQATRAARVH